MKDSEYVFNTCLQRIEHTTHKTHIYGSSKMMCLTTKLKQHVLHNLNFSECVFDAHCQPLNILVNCTLTF